MAIAVFLLVLICAVLAISGYSYYIAFYSPRKGRRKDTDLPNTEQYNVFREDNLKRINRLREEEHEEVSIRTYDGLCLTGKYYHRHDHAAVAICFHGWRGSGIRDFCGGAFSLMEQGFNVLLVDQRAQGGSDGHTITFGIKERFDCLEWVRYVSDRFGPETDIFLYGVSMGGATVLMAAGLGLPDNVRCVVADSPYSSPKAIIQKVCADMKIPPALAYPFVALGARLFGGFSLSAATTEEAVRKATVPILVIHGTDDRFVPCSMSESFTVNPHVQRQTFPGAGHGLSFLVDQPRYEKLIRDFTLQTGR